MALPHNDDFWLPWGGNRLPKTLWEKKKKLVTNIFSFSHNVFCSMKDKIHNVWITLHLSSANAFRIGKANILSSGKFLIQSIQDVRDEVLMAHDACVHILHHWFYTISLCNHSYARERRYVYKIKCQCINLSWSDNNRNNQVESFYLSR